MFYITNTTDIVFIKFVPINNNKKFFYFIFTKKIAIILILIFLQRRNIDPCENSRKK